MPTNRVRRRQAPRVPLEPAMKEWFLSGDFVQAVAAVPAGSKGFAGLGQLLLGWMDHAALWRAHRDELLEAAVPDWPWAYYEFEHPELRPAPESSHMETDGDEPDDLDDADAAREDDDAVPG